MIENHQLGSYTKYSTTEQVVGEWINGKPVYQKTIDFGAKLKSGNYSTGIGVIDKVIDLKGFLERNTGGATYPLPVAKPGDNVGFNYMGDGDTLTVYVEADWSAYIHCYVTLYYTKTTD